MSDEEKKAIEYVKNIKSWWWDNSPNRIYSINRTDIEQFDIVLNLTERQQKEIEELKEENEKYKNPPFFDEDKYTENDKIKAKIEEVKEEKEHYLEINDEYNAQICDCIIEEYESLLEKE